MERLIVQVKVVNVAGGVVAVHNIPGEGDVSAVLTDNLEVADKTNLGNYNSKY